MLRYTLLFVSCFLGLSGGAFANIYVWEGDPNDCTISDVYNTITINEAGTYGFRAFDPNDPNDPNDVLSIQNIDVDPNVAGDVTVTIAWDENGGNGAADVWQGNLTVDGYEVYLAGLEISGSLGTTSTGFTCEDVTGNISVGGSIATGGDVTCADVSGDIDIDGDIGGTTPGKKFFVRNATGAIIVHGKLRAYTTLQAETLGDLDIHSHPTQGDIAIKNDYAGTLTIHPSMYGDIRIGERDGGGNVTTASDLIGTLNFGRSLLGDVDITDDLATEGDDSGRILVGLQISGGHILVADAVTQARAVRAFRSATSWL